MEPMTGWTADKSDFETKKFSIYTAALKFDGITPGTDPDLVVFTKNNPFAAQFRKMLH